MPFSQVVFTAEMLVKREVQREKQLMRSSALLAWLMGYGPKKTYNDFINTLGLGDKKFTDNYDKKEAIKKSQSVIDMINKIRRKNNNGN